MSAQFPIVPGSRVGRRSSARLRLRIPAELVLIGGNLRCLLDDFSVTGARVTIPRQVARGEDALLRCGPLECFGRVMWVRDLTCGLLFDDMLEKSAVLVMRELGDHIAEVQREEDRRAAGEWIAGGHYRTR